MAIDLINFDTEEMSEEGAWLVLEHPITGLHLSAKIKLAGVDSQIYRAQIRKNQDKRLRRMKFKTSSREMENEGLALLCAITIEWDGIEEDGKELPCTKENIIHVYTKYPWIREQVDEFAGDRANFIKN